MSWHEPTTRGPSYFQLSFNLPIHDDDEVVPPILLVLILYILEHWPATHRVVSELQTCHKRLYSTETGSTDEHSRPWVRILKSFRHVECVTIEGSIAGFIEAFALRAMDIGMLRLRHVNIKDVDFTTTDFACLTQAFKGPPSLASSGTRSPLLHLHNCRLAGEALPDLSLAMNPQHIVS